MSRIEQFEDKCCECEELFLEKNVQYGDAITETGVLGAAVEFVGITGRLKNLVINSGDGGKAADRKALRDILIDAHNYAIIGLMMLDEENFTGVSDG